MEELSARLSSETFQALQNANVKTLPMIFKKTNLEWMQLSKLDQNKVNVIFKESANIILKNKICLASCLPEWKYLSTGCPAIDKLLKNGISLKGITELFGCSGVGKTQITLQLALMTQLPQHLGGLNKCVVYICTEDVFPIKRLRQLSNEFGEIYPIPYEDNIFIVHVADVVQLKKVLFKQLPKLLEFKNVGLIVIDSIAGVFRSENSDVNYTARTQDFVAIASKLTHYSEKLSLAVVCVNQVTDNIVTGITEPCLGLAWGNLVTTRLCASRIGFNSNRKLEVIFGPHLKPSWCHFKVTQGGIVDGE